MSKNSKGKTLKWKKVITDKYADYYTSIGPLRYSIIDGRLECFFYLYLDKIKLGQYVTFKKAEAATVRHARSKIKKMQREINKAKKILEKLDGTNNKKYPAMVIKLGRKHSSICLVTIGTSDTPLPFPSSILKKCGLRKGDRFYWIPTKNGSFSENDFERIEEEPIPSPEELNFDFEAIRRLEKNKVI